MLSPETKKLKKIFKEFTPFLPDKVRKITAPLIVICLLSIIIGCGSSGDDSGTPAKSSKKTIETYSLAGVSGSINETDKTIAVVMPAGTDVKALVASFTTTGDNVEVDSTVQKSGETPNGFTDPVVYTVIAENGSSVAYTVTVTVTEPANQLATAITVSMTPNDAGTNVPAGIYCTKTPSITGSYVVTDPDGGSVIVTEWRDNGVLTTTHTTTLPSGATSGTDTLPGPFAINHIITFKATADGVPSNTASATIV